jgi:Fe-S cluster assembly scaffold protein SufB
MTDLATDIIAARRTRALDSLGAIVMPVFRGTAGWEFTPIDKLDLDAFEPAPGGPGAGLVSVGDAIVPGEADPVPDAPVVMPLALAAERLPGVVERHLGSLVAPDSPFSARNDAHWTDGALVYVPRNVVVEEPIVLTNVLSEAGSSLHWRTLVVLDEDSRSDTYPTIRIGEDDVDVGHEATVSKVGEEQLFYLQSHGLPEEEASKLIVNGFIEPIVKELPMEYAVEMNRLIELQMEGSIG